MKTVLIFSAKGGPGKSTLAQNVAAAAAHAGLRVGMLDTDPQGSTADWLALRPADAPRIRHEQVPLSELHSAPVADDVDLMVVDTPPAPENHPAGLGLLFDAADLVLVPVRPRPMDLRSTDSLLPYLRSRRRPFAFVLNMVKRGVRETVEARELLAALGPVAPEDLPDLVDVYRTWLAGLGVVETTSTAAPAFAALWTYTASRLGIKVREPA